MELQNIKTIKCPICGCTDIISESLEIDTFGQIKIHCNGTRWEHRKFLCGKEIRYEPNFTKESLHGNCKNDPEYLALVQKRKEDKEKLLSFLEENDIDEALSNHIKNYTLLGL